MKICLVTSVASHYRAKIYSLIARQYDCDFFFTKNDGHLKLMDYGLLDNKVVEVQRKKIGPFFYQKGIPSLSSKQYERYIVMGDIHYLSTWLLMLRLKCKPRKKVFLWTHGWYGKESRTEALIKKCFYRMADGILLYGNYAKQLMSKEKINPNKMFVVHNSLDYDSQLELRNTITPSDIFKSHFNNDYPVLALIGRLNRRKNLGLLIEALRLLHKTSFKCNVIVIGDGDCRQSAEDKVLEYKLQDYVWFYGACYDEKINAELLFNSDLCVMPGDLGLTAIHAMMFGVPVIAHDLFSKHGPEFETIHPGVTGDFFKYNDAQSLADTIQKWLSTHHNKEIVRTACESEIDNSWTPDFQMSIINKALS